MVRYPEVDRPPTVVHPPVSLPSFVSLRQSCVMARHVSFGWDVSGRHSRAHAERQECGDDSRVRRVLGEDDSEPCASGGSPNNLPAVHAP
jgi:hypothetical protein